MPIINITIMILYNYYYYYRVSLTIGDKKVYVHTNQPDFNNAKDKPQKKNHTHGTILWISENINDKRIRGHITTSTFIYYHPVIPFSFKSPASSLFTELKVGGVFRLRGGLLDKWYGACVCVLSISSCCGVNNSISLS